MTSAREIEFTNALREYELGLQRVGLQAQDRLRWLLRFVGVDLGALSRGQQLDVIHELRAFTGEYGLQMVGDWALDADGEIISSQPAERQGGRADAAAAGTLESILPELHQRLRRQITRFIDEGRCSFRADLLYALMRSDDGRRVDQFTGGDDLAGQVFAAAFDLLRRYGHRVRRCGSPSCSAFYLAGRRQSYCSGRCSQRERTKRYRKKNPDAVSDMRHAAYAKRQRAKHGSKVKVQRRRRRR
jgi:hypothetical protein